MTALTVVVYGTPAPQGSKRHIGNGVMVESSAQVKPWREAVKWAVRTVHMPDNWRDLQGSWDPVKMIEGPVAVELVFTLRKPASAPKRRQTWPATRPDLDKLVRATLDGITESGAIRDDAQVVELTAAKRYPDEGEGALDRPGATITISALQPDQETRP